MEPGGNVGTAAWWVWLRPEFANNPRYRDLQPGQRYRGITHPGLRGDIWISLGLAGSIQAPADHFERKPVWPVEA